MPNSKPKAAARPILNSKQGHTFQRTGPIVQRNVPLHQRMSILDEYFECIQPKIADLDPMGCKKAASSAETARK